MTTPDNPHQLAELLPKVYNTELVPDNDIASSNRSSGLVLRRVAVECTGYVVRRVPEIGAGRAAAFGGRYRVRKRRVDIARLLWFLLRGHGRWIVKGWTWATYADLRSDVRRPAQQATRKHAAKRRKRSGPTRKPGGPSSGSACAVRGHAAVAWSCWSCSRRWRWCSAGRPCRAGWWRLRRPGLLLAAVTFMARWLLGSARSAGLFAAIWEGRDRTPGAGWLTQPDRDDADRGSTNA